MTKPRAIPGYVYRSGREHFHAIAIGVHAQAQCIEYSICQAANDQRYICYMVRSLARIRAHRLRSKVTTRGGYATRNDHKACTTILGASPSD